MEIDNLQHLSQQTMTVKKVLGAAVSSCADTLSIEEPLEIRMAYGSRGQRKQTTISVTMRTPGRDADLALGFLFTEGIIQAFDQVEKTSHLDGNIILVALKEGVVPQLSRVQRNFYTSSSCGVCGKTSIDSIKTNSAFQNLSKLRQAIAPDIFYALPQKLRAIQDEFSVTGGIHASGLFAADGSLLFLREDVGRHNALDKLIGHALMANRLPLQNCMLLLSGRASFELVQKAAMAGIELIAAIGAPSSLAVALAKEWDITLLGFLKDGRFNIYYQSPYLSIPGLNEKHA